MNAPAENPRPKPLSVSIDILDDWQNGGDFVEHNGVKEVPMNPHRTAAAVIYDPNISDDWVIFVRFDVEARGAPWVEDYLARVGSCRLVDLAGTVPRYVDGLIVDALRDEWDRYCERRAGP